MPTSLSQLRWLRRDFVCACIMTHIPTASHATTTARGGLQATGIH